MIIEWLDMGTKTGPSAAKGLQSRWAAYDTPEGESKNMQIRLNVYDDHFDAWWFPSGTSREALTEPDQQFIQMKFEYGADAELAKRWVLVWIREEFKVDIDVRRDYPQIRPIRVHPKTKGVMREIGMFEYPADMDDFLLTSVRVVENPAVPDGVAIPAEMISEWDELTETQRLLAECQQQNVRLNQENAKLRKDAGRLEEQLNDQFQRTLERNTELGIHLVFVGDTIASGQRFYSMKPGDPWQDVTIAVEAMYNKLTEKPSVRASAGVESPSAERLETDQQHFDRMFAEMTDFIRSRFNVLQRRDQELKDRDGKAQAVLAEQIKVFDEYRDGKCREVWFEGYYAYENFIAKVKDYAAGDIDDPPTEPKNPYQLDQRKEQDHG